MKNTAELLMLEGVVAECAECDGDRIFLPVDEHCGGGACEFCCTICGAAVLIDPLLSYTGPSVATHVAV